MILAPIVIIGGGLFYLFSRSPNDDQGNAFDVVVGFCREPCCGDCGGCIYGCNAHTAEYRARCQSYGAGCVDMIQCCCFEISQAPQTCVSGCIYGYEACRSLCIEAHPSCLDAAVDDCHGEGNLCCCDCSCIFGRGNAAAVQDERENLIPTIRPLHFIRSYDAVGLSRLVRNQVNNVVEAELPEVTTEVIEPHVIEIEEDQIEKIFYNLDEEEEKSEDNEEVFEIEMMSKSKTMKEPSLSALSALSALSVQFNDVDHHLNPESTPNDTIEPLVCYDGDVSDFEAEPDVALQASSNTIIQSENENLKEVKSSAAAPQSPPELMLLNGDLAVRLYADFIDSSSRSAKGPKIIRDEPEKGEAGRIESPRKKNVKFRRDVNVRSIPGNNNNSTTTDDHSGYYNDSDDSLDN